MTTYLVVAKHEVEYTYMVEAETQKEAIRQVLENEVEGDLSDESAKEIISVEKGSD